MVDSSAENLLSLDSDVARGWKALRAWRAELTTDPDTAADEPPLEAVRHVAGKSTWDALGALTPAEADAPLRDALKRWVFSLTMARIAVPVEVARARAASNRRGKFPGSSGRTVSWLEAWRGVVSARTAAETGLWLEAAASSAPAVAEASRLLAERRVEVARRFGADHPWTPTAPAGRGVLRDAAEGLIDRTDDLSKTVWSEALSAAPEPSTVLHAAMARDAGEGWPARVTAYWLADALAGAPRGLRLDLSPLPTALGASSFARALVAFGHALRVAEAPSSMPFALSHDPAFVAAHRLGFAVGALALDPRWQQDTLGIGRRAALAQSIILARTALLETRLHAARLLLGDDAGFAPQDRFDELGVRLFGRQLDVRLRGAWPTVREDEPARFAGLLQALPFNESLRESFDSDWYRNPRAWAHLRATAAAPARETPMESEALVQSVEALVRAFERILG
jgi:hypothetical protein